MALGALFNQITDFLAPYVSDVETRRTLILPALGHLPLIKRIVWEGNAHNFAVHLIMTLDQ